MLLQYTSSCSPITSPRISTSLKLIRCRKISIPAQISNNKTIDSTPKNISTNRDQINIRKKSSDSQKSMLFHTPKASYLSKKTQDFDKNSKTPKNNSEYLLRNLNKSGLSKFGTPKAKKLKIFQGSENDDLSTFSLTLGSFTEMVNTQKKYIKSSFMPKVENQDIKNIEKEQKDCMLKITRKLSMTEGKKLLPRIKSLDNKEFTKYDDFIENSMRNKYYRNNYVVSANKINIKNNDVFTISKIWKEVEKTKINKYFSGPLCIKRVNSVKTPKNRQAFSKNNEKCARNIQKNEIILKLSKKAHKMIIMNMGIHEIYPASYTIKSM